MASGEQPKTNGQGSDLPVSGGAERPAVNGSTILPHGLTTDSARRQLQRIAASRAFSSSERHQCFLKFTVERALMGDPPKEHQLGVEVFGRTEDFDPRIDTVVRVEAHRLRARLKKYYETEGTGDDLILEFPAGGYVPTFRLSNPPRLTGSESSEVNGGDPDGREPKRSHPPRKRRIVELLLAAAASAALVVLILAVVSPFKEAVAIPPRRFSLLTGDNPTQRLGPLEHYPMIAISSDGRSVAYVVREAHSQRLYVRRLDELEARPLEGTEGASRPFFSPDGAWVGFFAQGSVKKIALSGGSPLTICKQNGHGASWGPNGSIVIGGNPYVGLKLVSASGGEVRDLTKLDREAGEVAHGWPHFLPDGEHIVFGAWLGGGFDQTPIVLYSLKTGARKQVALGSAPVYAASGHLLYARDNTLLSARFDLRKQTAEGEHPVLPGVAWGALCGISHFGVSRDGTLVYASASPEEGRFLYRVEPGGKLQPIVNERREYYHPRLSPDGKNLAVSVLSGGRYSVWIIDLVAGTSRRLTVSPHRSVFAIWSPDGAWLAFASDRDGPYSVYRQRADGGAEAERLTVAKSPQIPLSWAPDGSGLVYGEMHEKTGSDLVWLPLDETRKPRPLLKTEFQEEAAQFSPDGKWVAYVSNESGQKEVYVHRFANPEISWQVSSDGGRAPVWSPRGNEVIYQRQGALLAVRGYFGETPRFEKPRPVLELQLMDGVFPYLTNYDVTRDGKGFIVLTDEPASKRPSLNVVTNWFGVTGQRATPDVRAESR